MNKKLQLAIRIIISLALLAYIVNKITLKAVLEAISSADLKYVPAIVLLFLISFLIKAVNYRLLTAPLAKISAVRLLKISVLTWVAGMFAPGKVGELSVIYFLNKQGIPLGAATAVSVLDKLITISVLTVTAAIGLALFLDKTEAIQIVALLIIGLVGLIMLIASSKARYLIRRFVLGKHESRFAGFSRHLLEYTKNNKLL
ncbi:MAG: lysylphosphatidylglycerol synthase transmembrane domain-containing protein, partial [Nanoarchaeota archaeon]